MYRLYIGLSLWVLAFCAAGCRKSSDEYDYEDFPREQTIGICKSIIESTRTSERGKRLAKKALDGWDNGVLDPAPILIDAGFYQHYYPPDIYTLYLMMSDEEMDIAGIRIKEVHQQPEGQSVVIEEDYRLFVRSSIGHHQCVRFKERGPGDSKDEVLWAGYVENGEWGEDECPTVWISIPSAGQIDVEISVYDKSGNVSEPVPLELGHLYR